MRGSYRDTVIHASGRREPTSPWRPNAIVESCWPLLAGLLKNEPGLDGILYWAVGEGEPEWDAAPVPAGPSAERLRAEAARAPVTPEDVVYLDEAGEPTTEPTARLEIRARFAWSEDRVLREFGIFGGDASDEADTGRLINYVIHERREVRAGTTLERRLRFSFRKEGIGRWLEPADHWLASRSVGLVDGVGEAFSDALRSERIETIDALARCEPVRDRGDVPLVTLVELRSKARLALRVAAEIRVSEGFHPRTAWEVLVTPTATLAEDAGATPEEAAWLREKIGALELSLNHRFLNSLTVGELVGRHEAVR